MKKNFLSKKKIYIYIYRRIYPRTNGENKAIQTKSHTEAYTYTLTKRGKGEKIIHLAPKVHLLYLG